MKAFNNSKLKNTFLIEQAESLFAKKFIEKEQLNQIERELPSLKQSSFFIRIGFFLLGCFLISSILGFISIFTLSVVDEHYSIQLYLGFLFSLVGSEALSKKEYYKHGLNDAFILSIILFLSLAVGLSTESIVFGLLTFVLSSLFCSIRYIHTISAALFCIAVISLASYLVIEEKFLNTAYLPFLGLLIGLILYTGNYFIRQKETFYFYKNSFFVVKVFSLLLIYFSMNYLVVRELSQSLMNIKVVPGKDIPFALIFYIVTFAIPLFYIIYGLRKKDRIFLLTGFFALGFGFFTIRYYYSILPLETVFVICGILLFTISIIIINKLKKNTEGLTFQPDRDNDNSFILNAQAFLVTSQVNTNAPTISENKIPFGGGGYSGGGAGESF